MLLTATFQLDLVNKFAYFTNYKFCNALCYSISLLQIFIFVLLTIKKTTRN